MMMSRLKVSALATIICFSVASAAGDIASDKKVVGVACKKDAEKIGCKMGMDSGMFKCMFEYKKTHQEWNPSETCKSALKQLRKDNAGARAKGGGGH